MSRAGDIVGAVAFAAFATAIVTDKWRSRQTVFGPILDSEGETGFIAALNDTGQEVATVFQSLSSERGSTPRT